MHQVIFSQGRRYELADGVCPKCRQKSLKFDKMANAPEGKIKVICSFCDYETLEDKR